MNKLVHFSQLQRISLQNYLLFIYFLLLDIIERLNKEKKKREKENNNNNNNNNNYK